MHHADAAVEDRRAASARCCSGVPNCSSVGPIWRSANHDVASGAPVADERLEHDEPLERGATAAARLDRPGHAEPAALAELERERAVGAAIQVSSVSSACSAAARPDLARLLLEGQQLGGSAKSMRPPRVPRRGPRLGGPTAREAARSPSAANLLGVRWSTVRFAAVLVRPLGPDETGLQEALGAITVAAYRAARTGPSSSTGTTRSSRDVAGRVAAAEVLIALDGDEVLGGVTYVPDVGSPMAEFTDPDAAGVRMLAVAERCSAEGSGRR